MPTCSASSRCVQRSRRSPSGVSVGRVQASAINFARVCGPCTSGRPGRGASRRPGSPSASKRRRHFFTVCSEQPTSLAILAAERPSAAASTIRARSTARRSAVRERTIRSNTRRSSTLIPICFAAAAISIASIVAQQDDDVFDREQPVPANRATTAQWHAERRASRPKVSKLAANDALREYVQERLAGTIARPDGGPVPGPTVRFTSRRHGRRQDRRWATSWSPEQIANRLRIDFPDDDSMRISHEAIYQALYVQGRGALRRELVACLRTGRALRVPRARTQARGKKFVTAEVMISERPAEAADRAVPGHWEGDLILGLNSSA